MALRKNFETETETETTTATEEGTMNTTTATPVSSPAAEASTAIAKASATSVAAARSFAPALADAENVISPQDVADLGPGAFPKLTVDLGGFLMDKKDIGQKIRVELISWNKRWVVSPGVQNAEANELVKFSMDGVNLSGDTRTVKEYVNFLRDVEGYKDAAVKEYYSLWGNLVYANGADVAPIDQRMVEVQLSPQSVGQFKAFQIEYGMKVSRGLVPDTKLLELTAEKKELKTNRFGIVKFAAIV